MSMKKSPLHASSFRISFFNTCQPPQTVIYHSHMVNIRKRYQSSCQILRKLVRVVSKSALKHPPPPQIKQQQQQQQKNKKQQQQQQQKNQQTNKKQK